VVRRNVCATGQLCRRLLDCTTCGFDVGHALACRRAEARHLRVARRDKLKKSSPQGKSQASSADDDCRLYKPVAEARASSARLGGLNACPPNKTPTRVSALQTRVPAPRRSHRPVLPRTTVELYKPVTAGTRELRSPSTGQAEACPTKQECRRACQTLRASVTTTLPSVLAWDPCGWPFAPGCSMQPRPPAAALMLLPRTSADRTRLRRRPGSA
jgi:hypothetical protein